jgi:hypothetical protein
MHYPGSVDPMNLTVTRCLAQLTTAAAADAAAPYLLLFGLTAGWHSVRCHPIAAPVIWEVCRHIICSHPVPHTLTHLDTESEPLCPAAPLLQRLCIGGLCLKPQHLASSTQLCHYKGRCGVEVPQLLAALLDVGQVSMQCIHLHLDLQEPFMQAGQHIKGRGCADWIEGPLSR